jgi:alcohol dehydrogenase class IV
MNFSFATATRIVFGPGTLTSAADAAARMGKHWLLVTGRDAARADGLKGLLTGAGVRVQVLAIDGEPETDAISRAAEAARRDAVDAVVGMGGGSAIDAAKAIAALVTNSGDVTDYLEVVGRGRPLGQRPVPCIAVPTTAGTGAEVTANAVLRSPAQGVKVSLRSTWMLPRLAVVDPELTIAMPPAVTAATGMDALTQLIEAYVSKQANPLTDGICREGMRQAAAGLLPACRRGEDLGARTAMCVASLFGGLALANAKLGAVHGLAAPLGGRLQLPHGAVCAHLLAPVMAANITGLRQAAEGAEGLRRYADVARILTGEPDATADDGVARVQQMTAQMELAPLATTVPTPSLASDIARQAAQASSMKGNPVVLAPETLAKILDGVLTVGPLGRG